MTTDNVDFSVGDWVAILDNYRAMPGVDRGAAYGQVEHAAQGKICGVACTVYRVHCNNDSHHYLFHDELRLLPSNISKQREEPSNE